MTARDSRSGSDATATDARAAPPVYRIAGDSPLVWRRWDHDEALVYHDSSGRTHLLDALSAEVMMQLQVRPMSASDLIEAVQRQLAIEPDSIRERLPDICRSLLSIGLIDTP